MKVTKTSVVTKPKFEPFELKLVVETKAELDELLARFNTAGYNLSWPGNRPNECVLRDSGIYSVLLEEYRKY